MFERSLLNSSSPRKTMPLAYLLESALLGLLVLVPLINTRALTVNELRNAWTVFIPPPPPGPPPGQRPASRPNVARHLPTPDKLQAPPVIPTHIVKYAEEPSPPPQPEIGVLGGINFGPVGRDDGVMRNILAGTTLPPPPPLAAAKARAPLQIRQGGQVVAAKAIYQPAPVYPPLAQRARVEGVVRLEAVIATDGTIQNLRALSGHPLLVGAALEAVSHWRYQPTLLNGEAVEVSTEIDVTFRLAE
ncbi:MAG: energy transducer TonB [Acidobacteriia bacterium]|nr:energy transducer TonB [Terriglobia bacterium]